MGLFDIFRISKIKQENEQLKAANAEIQQKIDYLGVNEYFQTKEKIDRLTKECDEKLAVANREVDSYNKTITNLKEEAMRLEEKNAKLEKQISSQNKKLSRSREIYKSVDHAIQNFFESEAEYSNCKLSTRDFEEMELISPSIILKLHCMDMKDLRKAYKENERQINSILDKYSSRYTTKANKSIYDLMVIALRAELQNILYNLKYEKLDKSINDVKTVSAKYLKIAGDGNQNIAGTLTKFIGEIEYLFINAVKIEYNYYVKKEQARQEQLAIREQMRQEAEERKALEAEKKKIEKEESKYHSEIARIQEAIGTAADEREEKQLQAKIVELQSKLSDVIIKKDEITNLQNGKAGNIYVISNLGSFGDDVFKIGMTRRLDPQDRINELGNASVPFKFDVHSFIFSEDAVSLEKKLHDTLNDKRLNKVNMRKEFFKVTIDELEKLITDIDPTVEFSRTMAAEEFYQSLSTNEIYNSDFTLQDVDEED